MRFAVSRLLPLTGRGALLAALSLLAVAHWGRARADLVAGVLGLSGLALVALCGLASVLGLALAARALRRARCAPGLVLECGRARETGLAPAALRGLPLVEWRWRWRRPHSVACRVQEHAGRLRERVTPERRFATGRVERALELGDVLGLWRLGMRCREPTRVIALPDPGALRGLPWPEVLRAGDGLPDPDARAAGDLLELRAYVPGDPARRILWRSWARARRLEVRVPERALAPAGSVHAYLIAGPDDEAAAAAARVALESGALGPRWRLGVDGAEPATRLAPALEAIAGSAAYAGPCGVEAFAADARGGLLVFCPAAAGPWAAALERLAHARPGALRVVAASDARDEHALRRAHAALARALPGVPLWGISRATGQRLALRHAARSAA